LILDVASNAGHNKVVALEPLEQVESDIVPGLEDDVYLLILGCASFDSAWRRDAATSIEASLDFLGPCIHHVGNLGGDVVVCLLHLPLECLEVSGLCEIVYDLSRNDKHDPLCLRDLGKHADVSEVLISKQSVSPCHHDAPDHAVSDVEIQARELRALIISF